MSCADDHALLFRMAREADVLVMQGLMLRRFPKLGKLGKKIVMDLYDPFVFEAYPQTNLDSPEGRAILIDLWDIMNEQMDAADFMICASERQRDMYLGRLCALGRLRPEIAASDPSFRTLIDVVPFGLPESEPVATGQPALRGVVPGIGADDRILVWGGGIWDWFDPLTVIQAVAEISKERGDIRLVFLGTRPPNPELPEMSMTQRARDLSDALGLTGCFVFFNEGWVPYARRQDFLLEADIGISSHFDAIETRFAFRTRIQDYLWTGLPVFTTEGDSISEEVRARGLGAVIPYKSVEGWVDALRQILADAEEIGATRSRVLAHREAIRWSRTTLPLQAYCVSPWSHSRPTWSVSRAYGREARPWWSRLRRAVMRVWSEGGPRLLAEKSARFLFRQLSGAW
ncbi:MAG: glycosyltransferase [Candidatus Sericytochromatia bacterium]|nr:glycosyltransferase [Candidatus Sericytochromatia bacterium]